MERIKLMQTKMLKLLIVKKLNKMYLVNTMENQIEKVLILAELLVINENNYSVLNKMIKNTMKVC